MPREQARVGIVVMGRRRPVHFTEPEPPTIDEWDAKAIAEAAARAAFPGEVVGLSPAASAEMLWEVRVAERVTGEVRRLPLDAPVWAAPAFGIELVLGNVATSPPAPRGAHSYDGAGRGARIPVTRYAPLPTMPAAEFDLALLVPQGVTAADIDRVIRSSAGDLLERLELFDQYTGKGVAPEFRSLAWRLTFRHPERTLRDKEIEGRRGKILSALEKELDVRHRSA
jgi:phenylalanyl-tRNA synthetase beta chain